MNQTENNFKRFVVHCKKSPYDIYIGRQCYSMPKGEVSLWGNPFVMKDQSESERIRVSNEYRQWVYSQPDLIQKIRRELKGKILGCFCSPKSCHGDTLAEVANTDNIDQLISQSSTTNITNNSSLDTQDNSIKKPKKKSQLDNFKSLLPTSSEVREEERKEIKVSSESSSSLSNNNSKINNGKNNNRKKATRTFPSNENLKSDSTSTSLSSNIPPPPLTTTTSNLSPVIDIGINITNSQMKSKWKSIIHRAVDSGVSHILLTGTTVENSQESISIANQWFQQIKHKNLFCIVGIHPHHANTYNETTDEILRSLIEKHSSVKHSNPNSVVVAVGECGLDFFRNLSPQEVQIEAFRKQIEIAVEYNLPIFVHDRDATSYILDVFSTITQNFTQLLPPVVIHCFTGKQEEMLEYVSKGFYIGITGYICKHQRGKELRDMLPLIPLDRIMIETDAPYMGFLRERRSSEPADVVKVAEEIARVLDRDVNEIREILYRNTLKFFRLPEIE